jgi:hypothetical protein
MDTSQHGNVVLRTILSYDRKVTSYKLALIRAINDVATAYPDIAAPVQDVAIPLWMLAEWWIAYYWPFVDESAPIFQRSRRQTSTNKHQDVTFRPALTALRQAWQDTTSTPSNPADGFVVRSELRLPRVQHEYDSMLRGAYQTACEAIMKALDNPIKYAGPDEKQWSVFPRPARLAQLPPTVVAIPGTQPTDRCLVVPATLWTTFCTMSRWIEALCIHEWCLFTERLVQEGQGITRGVVYQLLTAHPESRRHLTWERNQITLLMADGVTFHCPWTRRLITSNDDYDLDHLIPIALYPTNELWNLVPSDRAFNQHTKRDRLPSADTLARALPHLEHTYRQYGTLPTLTTVLQEDVALRFGRKIGSMTASFPEAVAQRVVHFVEHLAHARTSERFDGR